MSKLSPKEALSEHCDHCDGTGQCGEPGGCCFCHGAGRVTRTTHEPGSDNGATAPEPEWTWRSAWRGIIGALVDAATVKVDEDWPEKSIRALTAERDALRAKLWTCPDCAFSFDAIHKTQATGEYDCPLCEAERYRKALERITTFDGDEPCSERIAREALESSNG